MPGWVNEIAGLVQLVLNIAVVAGGAAIWKLYVDKLHASIVAKDSTIETVEKTRDFWKDKAEQLEKRSPEVVEIQLAERIKVRDAEIARMRADTEADKGVLRELEMNKGAMEQDLARTQGFRSMLALEEEAYLDGDANPEEGEVRADPPDDVSAEIEARLGEQAIVIEVELIGEVAVDSGQLMVTDPCYVDPDWQHEPFSVGEHVERSEDTLFHYSYDGACRATLSGGGHGELAFAGGHAGAGVAFSTAWGDGFYPVYAEKHDGRIVRVYVNVA